MAAAQSLVFSAEELLPAAWSHFRSEPIRMFNPGLIRDGESWILAYRVVGADGVRRIAIGRLDAQWRVMPDSPQPLSDHFQFAAGNDYPTVAKTWFADPRLYRFSNRLFIYWNSGWHEPRNFQFLQELEPTTLTPMGCAREMILQGARQKLEKNWTLFAGADGRLLCVYSTSPHRILEFSLEGRSDIVFSEVALTQWTLDDYPSSHGGIRGGAPPFLHQGLYWSFGHSVHDGPTGYRYVPAALAFEPKPPYAVVMRPVKPLTFATAGSERRKYPRLNPAVDDVIYPCGAAHEGARWVISHGINDEQCAVSFLDHGDVVDTVRRA